MKNKNFPFKNSREFQTKLVNEAYLYMGIPLLVFLWAFLEFLDNRLSPFMSANFVYLFVSVFSLIIIAFIWMALRIFKNGLNLAKQEENLKDKLIIYEKISGRKFLFLFFASAFAVLGLYLCAHEIFPGLYFVIIFIFSMGSPTKDRIVRDLNLRDENRKTMLTGEDFDF